jgi:chromosome condensin MukBEF ATPase and DNA-binding subunit MukB
MATLDAPRPYDALAARVAAAAALLSEPEREALVAREHEDASYEDIAAALGVDVADVRRLLEQFRAGQSARKAARQQAFAAALAHELGMPVAQVSAALSAMPERRGSHRG